MSETEIALARAYLTASDQDPVAALIRSIKDLARARRMLASREVDHESRYDMTPPRFAARDLRQPAIALG